MPDVLPDWRSTIARHFPEWATDEVVSVMMCESGGDANAVGGSSLGLMQINEPYHRDKLAPRESLFDPDVNMRVAAQIWRDSSWSAWSCRP